MTVEPTALPAFTDLTLPDALVRNLGKQNITAATSVQAAVIPDALAGRDVLGRARTGSGKTLAFGLPMLAKLHGKRSRPKSPRGLIVLPTRELANQVRLSLEPLAHAVGLKVTTVYGGTPYDRQIRRLKQGTDIVVATPGRLDDLIRKGACRLDAVEITVLDEADHLCDLGFFPTVNELLGMTPAGGQRLLLSATLDGDVDKIVRNHLDNPVVHEVDPEQSSITTMDHHVLVVGSHNKLETTLDLLRANPRSIVFTRTRHGATDLAKELTDAGVEAVDLHGALSQRLRERNLQKFRSGRAQVVVATDVAARGIHIDGIGLVVHYDLPAESKSYLHRSGRTARAGESGAVVTVTHHRGVREVLRLHRTAGVEARHHDAKTAPQPLTVDALATAGVPAREVKVADTRGGRPSGGRPQGGYRGGNRGPGGYRGQGGNRGGSRSPGGYRGGNRPQGGDRNRRPRAQA
ncbi:MAG TPA: DEAD/DEAH box helicase [Nocardioidaceae bacterium]|nr:DEAD/DEAH box helicase [Nocardioidaceae bacterium]